MKTEKELEIENNIYKAALEKILNFTDFENEVNYPSSVSMRENMVRNLGRIAAEILDIDEKISDEIYRAE